MAISFSQVQKLISEVDGWLSTGEAKYLYSLAGRRAANGVIVEIGSWKGKSTIVLAAGASAGQREKVYAIDHHKGSAEHVGLENRVVDTEQEFRRNISAAGVEPQVVPIIKTSTEAVKTWNLPISLLWIDGDHDYEAVKNDFLQWEPFVIEGGVIAFHDTYAWPGPNRLVEEQFIKSNLFRIIGFVDTITAVRKLKPSVFSATKVGLMLLLRRVYILGRQHKVPGEFRKWSKAALRMVASVG